MRDFQRPEQIRARAYSNRDAQLAGETLRHHEGVAVPHVEDAAQLAQLDDGGHEFIADALDAMAADLVAGAQSGRIRRFEWMRRLTRKILAQMLCEAHDRAASPDAGDESRGLASDGGQLRGDLWTGGFLMRLHIGGIVE